jgi:hypothetical protein
VLLPLAAQPFGDAAWFALAAHLAPRGGGGTSGLLSTFKATAHSKIIVRFATDWTI